ncbi:MAG: BON domain-containing protein [Acidobacteriaceae bacterium]
MYCWRSKVRRIPPSTFWCAARRIVRELLICVALPSVLMISAKVVAQKAAASQQNSDQQIAETLQTKLTAYFGSPLTFSVGIHDGAVTLSGMIPDSAQRAKAEALVHEVPGVTTVDDQLVIGAAPAPANNETGQAPPPPPTQSGEQPGAPSLTRPQNYPTAQSGREPYRSAMVTVPTGTPVYALMLQSFGSRHTKPGEQFHGVLAQDIVLSNGAIAIPRGATLSGVVIDARPAGHLKGRPKLALQLSNVVMGDTNYALNSSVWAREGPGKGGQTTANVAGSAAVGAFAGGIVGGGPTALLGAALGGLGGAGLSALSSGPRLFIPAESVLTFYLNAPLTVREPTPGEIRSLANNIPYGYGYRPPPPRYGYPPPQPVPGAPPGGYPY